MLRKLVCSLFVLSLIFPSQKVSACAFDAAIPYTKSDDFIDSYYYILDFEESGVDVDLYQFDQNYMYVVLTKEFVYVEAFLQDILGIYALDGLSVKSVEQSSEDQHVVVITFEDGEVIEIDSRKQNDNPQNIIYLDEESISGFSIKEEYLYMYDIEGDEVDEVIEEETIVEEKEDSSIFSSLVPLVTVFMLFFIPFIAVKYVNKKGEDDEIRS